MEIDCMNVSQKCQYALRALLELAKRNQTGPVKIADIARAQAIPAKFLEGILLELKKLGVVESKRGPKGGYLLAMPPEELTVGKIIQFIDGPPAPVACVAGEHHTQCPLFGQCAFLPMWRRARDAVANVYDQTTFQNLLEEDQRTNLPSAITYQI